MTLTLVIPALLWPRQVMRDTLYDIDFPALQTLLGFGRRLPSTTTSAEDWWHSYFRIGSGEFAAAPLRLSALGTPPGDARWMCADPVHLRIDQRGASLTDPALLNISAMEARKLQALLAPMLAKMGELVITTPSHWHLRLAKPARGFPAYLHDLVEQSAVALLPAGEEDRHWRQLINEMQTVLHADPLNAERSAQGKAIINSIVLWGEGCSPVLPSKAPGILLSDDLIIAGAAKLAGLEISALPAQFTAPKTATIVNWDSLRFPTARHDALAWREALLELEQDWLAPALSALTSGVLKRIELHAFGEQESISIAMSPLDRYCFWRKPRRLESL